MDEIRYCALPECNRVVKSWRMVCCCLRHNAVYAGRKRGRSNGLALTVEERKAKWSAYVVCRRKKRDKSMPSWADKNKIFEFYRLARELTKETGILHEVDHIIPSNHKLVCGLHNEFNLQVITGKENRQKSNIFEIT